MLCLTRMPDEAIVIGSDVRVVVLRVSGNKVRLGIEAPREIVVHREEIAKKIKRQGRKSLDRLDKAG